MFKRLALALFLCASVARIASADTTALFFDSQTGDWVGGGTQHTYLAADAAFTANANSYTGGLEVSVIAPGYTFWWYLDFKSAGKVPLAVGTYTATRRYSFSLYNGMDVSGSGRGCNTITGRFLVREIVYGANNTIVRAAIDFEQHCDDATPALFGALRINSTISDLTPFSGDYPHARLTVTQPAHGTVSGPNLLCGTGGSSCSTTLASAASIVVSATPDSGYIFAGWSGDCYGTQDTAVNVNGEKVCAAAFEPVSSTPRTLLLLDSQPGDVVGGGVAQTWSSANSVWGPTQSGAQVSLQVRTQTVQEIDWSVMFSAPSGQRLQSGVTYTHAIRAPFNSVLPGLSVQGSRGCNSLSGRFTVLDIAYDFDGSLQRFAADFEQHCEDAGPALFGAVRYNSTIADVIPFGGAYPTYSLSLAQPQHGRISGPSVDCGGGASVCSATFGSATNLTLTATPDSGYIFAGWTGDCYGNALTSLFANGPKQCGALFEPVTLSSGTRSLVIWTSQPGDSAGRGLNAVLSPQGTTWRVSGSGAQVSVDIYGATATLETHTLLAFGVPAGQVLQANHMYVHAATAYTHVLPTINVDVGGYCYPTAGRFLVRELEFAPDGSLLRVAIDFEQHCNNATPALIGALRYNSTVPDISPFQGDYGVYRLSVAQPAHGRITGSGLDCSATNATCTTQVSSASAVLFSAAPDSGYIFAGWTGDCHGAAATQLFLNGPKECGALFQPAVLSGGRTLVQLTSAPGELLAHGQSETFSPANSLSIASVFGAGNSLDISLWGAADVGEERWHFSFSAPVGQSLQIGAPYVVSSTSYSSTSPRMDIAGPSAFGCSGVGTFTLREFVYTAGVLNKLALDFELHCNVTTTPPLTGTIEYNADIAAPTLQLDRTAVAFAATMASGGFASVSAPQTIHLSESGQGGAVWTAAANQPWVTVSPSSGAGSATLVISVNYTAALPLSGTIHASVTISAPDAANTVGPIDVALTTMAAGASAAPFGSFDTPSNNSTGITGSIAVTGWALDDVGVSGVRIFRGAVLGETSGLVFIGNAVLIDGARTDVQSSYPKMPGNTRAGWGYLLLTNFLPNGGNGTFTFYAYADDLDGHTTLLGTKTITCDNAHGLAPFGAIDTPGQGETVSGVVSNFGWVLSPGAAKADPPDGGTVTVLVDGVSVGSPGGWTTRPDLSALFPSAQYSGIGNALGVYDLDLTTLANGPHTIAWVVTATDGRTSGIGSRYFTVSNGASIAAALRVRADAPDIRAALIRGRRGFDLSAPFVDYAADESGRVTIQAEEVDRIELLLPQGSAGALRTPHGLDALPIGSHLDATTGTFTWMPGPGFVGAYDFVFGGQDLRIVLNPKGSNRVGVQTIIDLPASAGSHNRGVVTEGVVAEGVVASTFRWKEPADRVVASTFRWKEPILVTGWATDPGSIFDTGVDAVHVWAYPVKATGGYTDPVFLGAATYGGPRPDVGAIYGDRFTNSGYGLIVGDLGPGIYDLAVFAHSTVTGQFGPAQIVRVFVR